MPRVQTKSAPTKFKGEYDYGESFFNNMSNYACLSMQQMPRDVTDKLTMSVAQSSTLLKPKMLTSEKIGIL